MEKKEIMINNDLKKDTGSKLDSSSFLELIKPITMGIDDKTNITKLFIKLTFFPF